MMIKLRQTGREKERERDKEREKERDKEIWDGEGLIVWDWLTVLEWFLIPYDESSTPTIVWALKKRKTIVPLCIFLGKRWKKFHKVYFKLKLQKY